jgi:hypothetical protein
MRSPGTKLAKGTRVGTSQIRVPACLGPRFSKAEYNPTCNLKLTISSHLLAMIPSKNAFLPPSAGFWISFRKLMGDTGETPQART